MDVSFADIEMVVMMLQQSSALSGRYYLAGGTVPWLLANRDSNRVHSDIDIVAHASTMGLFRSQMQEMGYYDVKTDAGVSAHRYQDDYGFDVVIAGVTLNIAPFECVSAGIVQRNATYSPLGSVDMRISIMIPDLRCTEYVMHTQWRGSHLGHYPLALIYATKRLTKRHKDVVDCGVIEQIGVYQRDIDRYADVLNRMHIAVNTTVDEDAMQ